MTTGAARRPLAERSRWPNRSARAAGAPVPPRDIRLRGRRWQPDLSWRSGLALIGPLLIMGVLFLIYPIIRLIIVAFGPPSGAGNFSAYFHETVNLTVLRVTFTDSAIVAILSVTLAAVVAWHVHATRTRSVRLLLIGALFVPFWMGSVVKLYAFTILLERLGLVNRTLLDLHLISSPLSLIYNQFAVIIGMVYQLLPYAVLPLLVVFRSIDEDLLRAAQGLGASRIRAIRSVVIPLGMPGILASATIVYVVGIGFFLTPVLLGGATSPFSASFMYDDIFSYYDFTSATVSALVLVAGAAVILLLASRLVGRDQLRRVLG
jgi:ABC-type spermidine/putrescine transport system permease subunit I